MGKRPRYTKEFKLQALELLRASGKTVGQVAKELGVAKSALYRWQRAPAKTPEGQRARAISLEEENRELRRENLRLKMEQEFLSENLDAGVALAALRMALERRRPPAGLVHHSDRGVQYASESYRTALVANGMVPSMSRKGNCWTTPLPRASSAA